MSEFDTGRRGDDKAESVLKLTPTVLTTWQEAVLVLRARHGMLEPIAQPDAPYQIFDQAFGLALGTDDHSTFELACPLLLVNRWEATDLIAATPRSNHGRLRLAAGLGLSFLSFSARPLIGAEMIVERLWLLEDSLKCCSLTTDHWSCDANLPASHYNPFLVRIYGLRALWPLEHFWKAYRTTLTKNRKRLADMRRADEIRRDRWTQAFGPDIAAINDLPQEQRDAARAKLLSQDAPPSSS